MRRRWVRLLLLAVAAVLVGLIGLAAFRVHQAASAGARGQNALESAAAMLTEGSGFGSVDDATLTRVKAKLAEAHDAFHDMRSDLDGAGPAYTAARGIPFLRVQVRGVDSINDVGDELSVAAMQFVDTAQRFVHPSGASRSLAHGNVLGELRELQASAAKATTELNLSYGHLTDLSGYRLVGPLGSARDTLSQRLPSLLDRATSARDGLAAFIAFAGGDGPRRYLVLSQNPDEVRPTGGYMGSFGVMSASNGHLHVLEYGDTNAWIAAHPGAVVAESAAPTVFKVAGSDQTLADTNAVPDWATAAQTAIRLWHDGGGAPVDGAVSFTQQFLARLVHVLGPIQVPGYGDTITGANLVSRTDYWVHHAPAQPVPGGRKEFLSVLAPLVLHEVETAPSSRWPQLATALTDGFGHQEAMLWSGDPHVQRVAEQHNWDYRLPRTSGDFFADSEFAFASKNGSSLRRTFEHTVALHADGSGTATTVMTVHDADPVFTSLINPGVSGWVTPYGPAGGSLTTASDPPDSEALPDLNGHPTAGWQLSSRPGEDATLRVGWSVPDMLVPKSGGRYEYSLTWWPTPSHSGDVVHLHVTPPAGWHWVGSAPPSTLSSDMITNGHWLLQKG